MRLKIKTSLSFLIVMISAILLSSCSESSGPASPGDGNIVIKIASVLPPDHPASQALEFFKTRLAEESSGRIVVQLFLNSQLGDTMESIQNCRNGNIHAVFASSAPLAQLVPEFNALGMPYIYRDKAHEFEVLDGSLGQALGVKLKGFNLHHLCYFDAGTRNMMTKKGPIEKPEDLKGLKIRVMPSKLMVETINALGAAAIAMSQGEVYSALQTGVLDGWENNPPTALSFKMYETGCIYFSWTRHLSVPDLLLINAEFYRSLPEETRQLLETVARETVLRQRELWRESEQAAVTALQAAGMIFNEVDLTAFAAQVEPVYEDAYAKWGPEFKETCLNIRELP